MTKNANKFFGIALLLTFLVSNVLTMLALQVMQRGDGTGLEAKQGDFIELLMLVLWTLLLTISSLTIVLNLIKSFRDNFILNFLSFYLGPTLVTLITYFSSQNKNGWLSIFVSSIIFLLVLTFFFVKFLRQKASFLN
ncbi:MAG: hypothetical protein QM726_16875 [Chitinophagaceae bacterium]